MAAAGKLQRLPGQPGGQLGQAGLWPTYISVAASGGAAAMMLQQLVRAGQVVSRRILAHGAPAAELGRDLPPGLPGPPGGRAQHQRPGSAPRSRSQSPAAAASRLPARR